MLVETVLNGDDNGETRQENASLLTPKQQLIQVTSGLQDPQGPAHLHHLGIELSLPYSTQQPWEKSFPGFIGSPPRV